MKIACSASEPKRELARKKDRFEDILHNSQSRLERKALTSYDRGCFIERRMRKKKTTQKRTLQFNNASKEPTANQVTLGSIRG